MNKYIPICLCMAVSFTACTASKRGLFVKRTPHEAYAARITDAGLRESLLGGRWFAAAEKGLARPLDITLPYQETGYFSAEDPDAAGFSFAARRGEQLFVSVQVKPATSSLVFTDLWQPGPEGGSPQHLASADSLRTLQYDVERDGRFILRLQPELLNNVEYTIQITTRPSLAFPVPGKSNARIGSFWGAARDGGARSHEGVDIFAQRRTPVVAAADGHVTRTGENNLGGKVVFMRPAQRDISLYYAHLDSQLVQPGQRVSMGDTLGLIGNTGNARNTAPHLHFGIYTASGAVDPLPYIQQNRKALPVISAPASWLTGYARSSGAAALHNGDGNEKILPNQVVYILGAAGTRFKVRLPDQREGFVESKSLSRKPFRNITTAAATPLLDAPDSLAATIRSIPAGTRLPVLGQHNGYFYIESESGKGWLRSI